MRIKLFYVPFYFCLANLAAFLGICLFLSGKRNRIWERAESTRWTLFIYIFETLILIEDIFFVEISFFLITGLLLLKDYPNKKRLGILMILLIISYTPTMFAPEKEVPVAVFSLMSLSFYFIFAAIAYWTEKKASWFNIFKRKT